jgi:hypothetical protein
MTPGRLVYLLWHRPIGAVKRSIREGGPVEQWITERGRREMEAAAGSLGLSLSKSRGSEGKPLELHMVVGKRFWYMAAFALVSLKKYLSSEVRVHFYSDGTLTAEHEKVLSQLPVEAVFHGTDEIMARLEKELPRARYPVLRERFDNYPNIRKLISPHVGSRGSKIVLDADVLFFGKPDELCEWFEKPKAVLCAMDITESYGYTRGLLEKLAGGRLPKKVNVGVTGLISEKIDWDQLEKWCAELHAKEGTSYYLEQALIAILCVKSGWNQLAQKRYITYPNETEATECRAVMHHYVDLSKKWYFRKNWQKALVPTISK